MDVWGFWAVVDIVGFSWGDVGEDCFGGGWLAILEVCPMYIFLVGRFMFIVICLLYIYMQILYPDRFENVLIYFLCYVDF